MSASHKFLKEYKTFNYPNRLVGLELYYYYLKEFDLLPVLLSTAMVIKLFRTISHDFISGYISDEDYEAIIQQIFYQYVEGEHESEYEQELLYLFRDASDFTYLEAGPDAIKRDLQAYFRKKPLVNE